MNVLICNNSIIAQLSSQQTSQDTGGDNITLNKKEICEVL